jgi:hypothetical protein
MVLADCHSAANDAEPCTTAHAGLLPVRAMKHARFVDQPVAQDAMSSSTAKRSGCLICLSLLIA